jgi:CMP-N,N'-diacetyllegionaminic acid synthase
VKVLGLIPARSGSKGLPGKNVAALAGRPLIAYAVDAARASEAVDRIVLTTDSAEIAAIGRAAGAEVPFLRPPALAQDGTAMLPVVEHAVHVLERDNWSPDIIVLLQPTSPLRQGRSVAAAIALLRETNADSVVGVVRLPLHYSPDYVMRVDEGGRLVPFLADGARVTRRQDARPAYVRDGTVYCFWRRTLEQGGIYGRDCRPLVIPEAESLTIDTADDWAEAERRLAAGRRA